METKGLEAIRKAGAVLAQSKTELDQRKIALREEWEDTKSTVRNLWKDLNLSPRTIKVADKNITISSSKIDSGNAEIIVPSRQFLAEFQATVAEVLEKLTQQNNASFV